MQTLDPATAAYLAARGPVIVRWLVWIVARDRATNAPAPLGLWTGEYDATFLIGADARPYYAGAGILQPPQLSYAAGLNVRMQSITLNPLMPEIADLIRGYDSRLAPVEIHRVLFNPDTMAMVGSPVRRFKGTVDLVTLPKPAVGRPVSMTVRLAPQSRDLTKTLTLTKSDASHSRRAGDRFRRYAAVTQASVYWGENGPAVPKTIKS